jgi:hypothetical protein
MNLFYHSHYKAINTNHTLWSLNFNIYFTHLGTNLWFEVEPWCFAQEKLEEYLTKMYVTVNMTGWMYLTEM